MTRKELLTSKFERENATHMCVFVDNHVAGGIDTFLKLLLPRLNPRRGRIIFFVNSNYPNLETLTKVCRSTTDVFTYQSVFHRRWFTRLGSKARSPHTERVLGALRRCTEYLFLPLETLQLRRNIPVPPGCPLLIVNGGFPGSYAALAMVFAFAPTSNVFMNIHNFAVPRYRPSSFLESVLDRWIANRVKLFIGVSSISDESLKKRFRGLRIDSTFVYNAINPPHSLHRQISRKSSPTNGCVTLGLVGTLEARKGHLFALKILSALKPRRSERVVLRFIGSDPFNFGDKLRKEAQRLHLALDVEFAGYQSSHDLIYSDLDLIMIPSSENESFCFVGVEALGRGIPVVASSNGALPEILNGLPFCRVVTSFDVHDWVTEISKLLDENSTNSGHTPNSRLRRFLDPQQMANDYQLILETNR